MTPDQPHTVPEKKLNGWDVLKIELTRPLFVFVLGFIIGSKLAGL